jgi:hypothetical protein
MPQRPLSSVPRSVLLLLAAALIAQLLWTGVAPLQGPASAQTPALPPAPPLALLQVASLGERAAASRLLMLYLQSWDDQPGARISWRALDYGRLTDWLARALDLDPRSQYPLMSASGIYSAVNDPGRARQMLAFVHQRFSEDPNRRWPWLAYAAIAAQHRLHDPQLAQRYAAAIRSQATAASVPPWARQLDTILREDTSELDATRAVAGGLLATGQLRDPHELQQLERHLQGLAAPPP